MNQPNLNKQENINKINKPIKFKLNKKDIGIHPLSDILKHIFDGRNMSNIGDIDVEIDRNFIVTNIKYIKPISNLVKENNEENKTLEINVIKD